jgi:hypothetical protein
MIYSCSGCEGEQICIWNGWCSDTGTHAFTSKSSQVLIVSLNEWNGMEWSALYPVEEWVVIKMDTDLFIYLFISSINLFIKLNFGSKKVSSKNRVKALVWNDTILWESSEKWRFFLWFILVQDVKESRFAYEMSGVATLEHVCLPRKGKYACAFGASVHSVHSVLFNPFMWHTHVCPNGKNMIIYLFTSKSINLFEKIFFAQKRLRQKRGETRGMNTYMHTWIDR